MREPLPLYCKTSAAYAAARRPRRVQQGARRVGDRPTAGTARTASPSTCSCSAAQVPFADLLAAAPTPDEDGPGWPADEPTRFGRYARRLWDGLLAARGAGSNL